MVLSNGIFTYMLFFDMLFAVRILPDFMFRYSVSNISQVVSETYLAIIVPRCFIEMQVVYLELIKLFCKSSSKEKYNS